MENEETNIEELEYKRDLRLKALVEQLAQSLQNKSKTKAGTVAPSQRRVLCLLGTMGPLTQQRMLDELELAPASLSEVISKLEGKGMVSREPLESDKRVTLVSLTEEGHALAEELLAADLAIARKAFSKLSDEEKHQLETLLELMAH